MRLGVVIVSYNVRDLLRACLQSVYEDVARTPGLEAEVIVVDNASGDGSADMVAEEFPLARLVASEENLGFARGNNVALRMLGFGERSDGRGEADTIHPGAEGQTPSNVKRQASSPDVSRLTFDAFSDAPDANFNFVPQSRPSSKRKPNAVLLLNPDTELQPGALAAMTGFLASHPRAGGCCPRLNYGDGGFQHSAFRFPGLMQLVLDLHPIPRLMETRLNGRYPRRLYERAQPFPVDFALGAALMVRAEAIDAAGLLDEGYFMYAEEMDWQMRIQRAGWPIYCVPSARVTHYEGQSARQFRRAMTVALWRSRLRYYDKYHPAWKRRLERSLIARAMHKRLDEARAALAAGAGDAGELRDQIAAYEEILALVGE